MLRMYIEAGWFLFEEIRPKEAPRRINWLSRLFGRHSPQQPRDPLSLSLHVLRTLMLSSEWRIQNDGRFMATFEASEARRLEPMLKEVKLLSEVSEQVEVPRDLIPESAYNKPVKNGSEYRVRSAVKLDKVFLDPLTKGESVIFSFSPIVRMIAHGPDLETLTNELKKYGIKSCLHTVKVNSPE